MRPPSLAVAVHSAWLACALALAAGASAGAPAGPLARTESGWIRGITEDGAHKYLGVPFAAPPVGALRWRPPQPLAAWPGVRDAMLLQSACAQLASSNGPESTAEDCLYLNVYTPSDPSAFRKRLRPVLVWIHGGGNVNGSGNQQDAAELAALTHTVVVMVNYRLNVFGALALPALSAESADGSSGNLGLLDQQAAMRWVQRNIAGFGGDPRSVTIAGQSAGGHAVCTHLASPTAAGLFHRAIIHSGAFDLFLGPAGEAGVCGLVTLDAAEAAGTEFAAGLGCADPATAAACLRAKPAQELLAASAGFAAQNNQSGEVLPRPVLEAIAARDWNRVPMMVGSTHDELQPAAGNIPGGGLPLPPLVYFFALGALFGPESGAVLAEYPVADYADPAFALGAVLTDAGFACPTQKLRSFLSGFTPTYGFEFDDPDAPPGEQNGMPSGAYHAADVQYLFDYTPFQGTLAPEQRALSLEMMRYWGAFAAKGRPEVFGAPRWPRYREATPAVLSLRPAGSALIDDFAADHRCGFWSTIRP